jgi:hypothetical protein
VLGLSTTYSRTTAKNPCMEINRNSNAQIFALHEKAKKLILEKRNEEEIIFELKKEGIESGYAELIIQNVKTDLSDKTEFKRELVKGIAFTILGLILNLVSYIAFSNAREFFWIVYWGIVVFGISLIFRAFIIFKK